LAALVDKALLEPYQSIRALPATRIRKTKDRIKFAASVVLGAMAWEAMRNRVPRVTVSDGVSFFPEVRLAFFVELRLDPGWDVARPLQQLHDELVRACSDRPLSKAWGSLEVLEGKLTLSVRLEPTPIPAADE
jgi:hypothetical protein